MLVCLVSMTTVSAKINLGWNVKGGLGLSTWMGGNADSSEPLFNQKLGLGIDLPLTWLISFQTGMYWESKGASISFEDSALASAGSDKVKVNQNYLQIPLLAAFHVGTVSNFDLVFTCGPYLAYGLNGKMEASKGDLTVSCNSFGESDINGTLFEGLDRFDAGIQLGAALDFKKCSVGVDSEFSFCKLAEKTKAYNYGLYFTFGYKF